MTTVSICICTCRRPAALLRLLRSLHRLDPATPAHEIIVVDNDAGMSAASAVRTAQAEGLPVRYLVEPVRGIARARNRSVAPATGEYVAFIDDDEEADPRWLVALLGETRQHGADGAIGPVVPRLDAQAPRWLADGGFFDRPRPPTGTTLHARLARTGNALVRRRMLAALPGPFDERYDLTGGEDTDLFARLIAAGGRVIAVDTAVVFEHLPPSRSTVRWLLRRRFLNGVGSARHYVATVPRAAQRRWLRTRSLASALSWGFRGVLLLPASRAAGLDRLTVAARHLGRLAFHSGFSFRPYAGDTWR